MLRDFNVVTAQLPNLGPETPEVSLLKNQTDYGS